MKKRNPIEEDYETTQFEKNPIWEDEKKPIQEDYKKNPILED